MTRLKDGGAGSDAERVESENCRDGSEAGIFAEHTESETGRHAKEFRGRGGPRRSRTASLDDSTPPNFKMALAAGFGGGHRPALQIVVDVECWKCDLEFVGVDSRSLAVFVKRAGEA